MFRIVILLGCLAAVFCLWLSCGQPVTPASEGTSRSEVQAGQEATSREAPSDDSGLTREAWTNREIAPLEGFQLDAGVPPEYAWGEPGAGFLQKVVSFHPKGAVSYGHEDFPRAIQGPPRGLGRSKGSLDVVSLGCGGSIVLEFSSPLIGNGPGADFIIFENAFSYGGKETFAEPARISVSVDGKTWHTFPCQPDTTKWPHPQCAGIREVYAHPDNTINPHDPQAAGGDAFDLEDLGLSFARFIKIEDLSHKHPEAKVWCSAYNAGFDLDAIAVRWGYRP